MILVLTDFHYAGKGARSTIPTRRSDLVRELLERVRAREEKPEAVLVLGDIIDNGRGDAAEDDWHDILDSLEKFNAPLVVIPGNHDRIPERFAGVFGEAKPVCITLGSGQRVRIIPFVDAYTDTDVCSRDFDRMEREFAAVSPEEQVIVCQHNTVLPAIESEYPYTMVRYRDIAAKYTAEKVALSLSGHYHTGIPAFVEGGVQYACIPALCEAPFGYAVVSEQGGNWNVEVKYLD